MMELAVRAATRAHIPTLIELVRSEALEAEGRDPPVDSLRRGIAQPLDDPTLARYWVLTRSGSEIVGSASVTTEWSDWRGAPYWWLSI